MFSRGYGRGAVEIAATAMAMAGGGSCWRGEDEALWRSHVAYWVDEVVNDDEDDGAVAELVVAAEH